MKSSLRRLILHAAVAATAAAFVAPQQKSTVPSLSSTWTTSLGLASTNSATGLVPIKEIVSVTIIDPESSDPPFIDKVPDLLPKDKDVYVTFEHYGEMKGKSIPFDSAHEAYVNLPIIARHTEPVKCEFKLPRRFRRDKTLFTANLVLSDDQSDSLTGMGEVTGNIQDRKGNDVGLILKASTFSTEWESEVVGMVDNSKGQNKDLYFRALSASLMKQVEALDLGGADILERPVDKADRNLEMASLLGGLIEYPRRDEFLELPFLIKVVLPAMNKFVRNSERTIPVKDRASSINEARLSLQSAVKSPHEGRWVKPLSDESMHRVFLSSLGMPYVKKHSETGGYVADLSYLGELAYKPSMENIGCKVYFDSNADVTQIEDHDGAVYRPGDSSWAWAKLKARSAAFVLGSLNHITTYHFTWGCAPGAALRMFLPPSHPIRMALSVHFFRTHFTCAKAQDALLSEVGVLGRTLPFAYKGGLEKAYIDLMSDWNFSTYPDRLEQQGVRECEHYIGSSDGLELHKVMADYASNLFDEVYESEERFMSDGAMRDVYKYLTKKMHGIPAEYSMTSMKLVWGEILFAVTGGHSNIGNSMAYALDPFIVNFRMLKEHKGLVKSSKENDVAVVGITALTIPDDYPRLCQDWSHVLHDPNSQAYATLRSDLDVLSKSIDKRNNSEERRFVNRDFHPDHCAVSVFS